MLFSNLCLYSRLKGKKQLPHPAVRGKGSIKSQIFGQCKGLFGHIKADFFFYLVTTISSADSPIFIIPDTHT